jgi:hypothetical protein
LWERSLYTRHNAMHQCKVFCQNINSSWDVLSLTWGILNETEHSFFTSHLAHPSQLFSPLCVHIHNESVEVLKLRI